MRRGIRVRWEFDDHGELPAGGEASSLEAEVGEPLSVGQIVMEDLLTTHFQPIFHAREGSVFGLECLTRLKGDQPGFSIGDLFQRAIQSGTVAMLDEKCLETALKRA